MSKITVTEKFADDVGAIIEYASEKIGNALVMKACTADYAKRQLTKIVEIEKALEQAEIIEKKERK